jgi:hypothetical protein
MTSCGVSDCDEPCTPSGQDAQCGRRAESPRPNRMLRSKHHPDRAVATTRAWQKQRTPLRHYAAEHPRAWAGLLCGSRSPSRDHARLKFPALLTSAQGVTADNSDLAGDIGRAVLASLHPPRRPAPAKSNHPPAAGKPTPQANPAPPSPSPASPPKSPPYHHEKKTRRPRSRAPAPAPLTPRHCVMARRTIRLLADPNRAVCRSRCAGADVPAR